MIYAPVVIPTLNRYEHLKELIESLKVNPYAKRTELFIGVDYPPSEKYVEGYEKIKEYLSGGIDGFLKVNVFFREENYGAYKNLEDLKQRALEKYDRYIVSEDDNVFSPCFLEYIDKALEYSEKDEDIFAVSGFSYPVSWVDKKGEGLVKEQSFFSVWGYGILAKKADEFEKRVEKGYFLQSLRKKEVARRVKKQSKKNYYYLVDLAYGNKKYTHDIAKSLYMIIENQYCIMPKTSLVKNCGWEGSGINCAKDVYGFGNQKISEESTFEFSVKGEVIEHYSENERIINEFFKPLKFQWLKCFVKKILIRFNKFKKQ